MLNVLSEFYLMYLWVICYKNENKMKVLYVYRICYFEIKGGVE